MLMLKYKDEFTNVNSWIGEGKKKTKKETNKERSKKRTFTYTITFWVPFFHPFLKKIFLRGEFLTSKR